MHLHLLLLLGAKGDHRRKAAAPTLAAFLGRCGLSCSCSHWPFYCPLGQKQVSHHPTLTGLPHSTEGTDLLPLLCISDPPIPQECSETQLPPHLKHSSMMLDKRPTEMAGTIPPQTLPLPSGRWNFPRSAWQRVRNCGGHSVPSFQVWDETGAPFSICLGEKSKAQQTPELCQGGHCPQKTSVAFAQLQVPSVPFSSSTFLSMPSVAPLFQD